jgi:hypothetical protein
MWRQPEHQAQRDQYVAIVDGLIARADEGPSLILFWTWGQNYSSADADLDGTAEPVNNGYAEPRAKFHRVGLHLVIVKWRWGLQFAMWVLAPITYVQALRDEIDSHCRLLTYHLVRNGHVPGLDRPCVEID